MHGKTGSRPSECHRAEREDQASQESSILLENGVDERLVQRVQTPRRSGEIYARGIELEEGIDEVFSGSGYGSAVKSHCVHLLKSPSRYGLIAR
jgi:hypothetical protein